MGLSKRPGRPFAVELRRSGDNGAVVHVDRDSSTIQIWSRGSVTDQRNLWDSRRNDTGERGLTQVQRVGPTHWDDSHLRVDPRVGRHKNSIDLGDAHCASPHGLEGKIRTKLGRQLDLIKRVFKIKLGNFQRLTSRKFQP